MADPNVTAETLTEEIARIVARPDDQITRGDLRRIAFIESITGSKRPDLPRKASYSFSDLADHGWLPSNDSDSYREVERLREWALTRSATGRAIVIERIRSGEAVPGNVLASLASTPGALAAAGIDEVDLLNSTLTKLRSSADQGSNDVRAELALARSIAVGLEVEGPQRVARDALVETLDANIRRHDGDLNDGYSNYIDFADLGRSISNGELLSRLRRMESAAIDDATAGAQAVTAPTGQAGDAVPADSIAW